jgi:hypothetical protein
VLIKSTILLSTAKVDILLICVLKGPAIPTLGAEAYGNVLEPAATVTYGRVIAFVA